MQEGGSSDVWASTVLPTAFVGRHDKDSKISSLWNEVWDEGGAAVGARDDAFGVLLQEKLLPNLTKNIIITLRSTSWSNRLGACAVISELTDANILAPTPCSSTGTPDRSEERFVIRAAASSSILLECVTMIARSNRIWSGKGEVIKAASSIAGKWTGIAPLNAKDYGGTIPLVFTSDSLDDLFVDDSWFKSSQIGQEQIIDEEEDEQDEEKVTTDDENNHSENETALDLTDEANLDEECLAINEQVGVQEIQKSNPITFMGLCRLMCDQGLRVSKNEFTEGVLPYKAAAFGSLSSLLRAVAKEDSETHDQVLRQQQLVYSMIAPRLYDFISDSQNGSTAPPLLVAKSLECLGSAFYDGIGDDQSSEHSNSLRMLKFLAECSGATQPAWTVRQSGVLAASSLVSKMASADLCKNEAIVTILGCSSHALKDRKFWKVR